MSPAALVRSLTPVGWLAVILAGLAIIALLLGGLGFRWDPFDLTRRRADAAQAQASAARAQALARAAEAEGQAGQLRRLEASIATVRRAEAITHAAASNARTADDADLPLPHDRLARLRAHDDELCRVAPDLGGCPAAPDPARGGDPAL